MPKRARGDGSLTGGLGDINPAFLSTSVTQSANDTTTTQTVQTPITIVAGRGQSDIMEVLKVFFYFDNSTPPSANQTVFMRCYISTKNFGTTEPSLKFGDALVFAGVQRINDVVQVTAVGEEITQWVDPIVFDLTDSAGHGFLVATSNIYAQMVSSNTGGTQTCRIKILYRIKKVGESQLMSLLLSQNQG